MSLDAMGEERWRYDLAYLSHGACRGFGDGKVHDLRVVEDKLIGVNDGCLLELDRDSGEIVKEQLLYAQAVEGRLRSDEQGGLYVADVAASGSILPLPNYLDATSDPSDQLTTGRVNLFVSKYTKELEHVWTRSFASVGSYGTDELHAPTLRGFDMSRDGIGYLLGFGGEHPFLIRFDADGKALDTMIILNRLYPTHQLAVSDDGSPYLAGTSKTTVEGVKTGMFIWNLAFDARGPGASDADPGSDAGATSTDSGAPRLDGRAADTSADGALVQSDAALDGGVQLSEP